MENCIRKVRLVAQDHPTGCGVACLASIQNLPYSEALKQCERTLDWGIKQKKFRLRVGEFQRVLDANSIPHSKTKFPGWGELPGVSIVGVKIHGDSSGFHHWVVLLSAGSRQLVMDPRFGEIYDRTTPRHRVHLQERAKSHVFYLAHKFGGGIEV